MSKKAQGFATIQVGRTGTGKTTFCKDMIDKLPKQRELIIFDINNEYDEYYDKEFVDFETFMDNIVPVKNSVILVEEASIFFSTRGTDKKLKDKLVRKRHENNVILLNFHSFSMIPEYVYQLVNYVTVFKTMDNVKKITDKYSNDRLVHAFEEVNSHEDVYYNKTVNLYAV